VERAQRGEPPEPAPKKQGAPEGRERAAQPQQPHLQRGLLPPLRGGVMETDRKPGGCARASLHHRLISQAPPGPLKLRSHSGNRRRPDPERRVGNTGFFGGEIDSHVNGQGPGPCLPGASRQLPSKKKLRSANVPAYLCRRGACSETPRKRRRRRSSASGETSSKLTLESRELKVGSSIPDEPEANIQHSRRVGDRSCHHPPATGDRSPGRCPGLRARPTDPAPAPDTARSRRRGRGPRCRSRESPSRG